LFFQSFVGYSLSIDGQRDIHWITKADFIVKITFLRLMDIALAQVQSEESIKQAMGKIKNRPDHLTIRPAFYTQGSGQFKKNPSKGIP